MVCVMAVEAPVKRQRKEEKVKKEEGTLWIGGWKVTVPPIDAESGGGGGEEVACTVKLWDEMAREWGDEVIRRGDVVLLESKSISLCLSIKSDILIRLQMSNLGHQRPRTQLR